MRLQIFILFLIFTGISCQKQPQEQAIIEGSEGHLKQVFEKILMQNTDVQSSLDVFLWTKEELLGMLNHPKKEEIVEAYLKMKDDFHQEAHLSLVDLYQKQGYQTLSVTLVRASAGKSLSYGDEALMLSLDARPNLYTLRLKKNELDQEGFRLNGWIYHNQQWKTFLKLGLIIDEINQNKESMPN